jgi:tetratricopeptide (TPR) repeat protein
MAERKRQTAHALFALGILNGALEMADAARHALPEDPSYDEFYGEIALASGRGADAAHAFRDALSSAVAGGTTTRFRAHLYDRLGQALEADGKGDLAVDAYRRAVELEATESHAVLRLAALDAAITGQTSR